MLETIYLDSAASTPISPQALEAMLEALHHVGNPGAAHAPGQQAARAVDQARGEVAELLGVGAANVVFTGSATEANNLALRGLQTDGVRTGLVTTTAEHPSVLVTVDELSRDRPTTTVPVTTAGLVDLDALSVVINDKTALVSIHAANNETGVIQPLEQVVALAHDHGALVHADASQLMAWGEAPLLDECDLITVSSHKMYGPQGAAALIVKGPARDVVRAQVTGGGQERGLRGGTVNVAAIAGFGAAARLALKTGTNAAKQTHALREALLAGLIARIPDLVEHGSAVERRLPGVLNIAVGTAQHDSVESDALLARIPELAASTGSACHSGAPGPSPVLLAMGVTEWEAARSIRLSLSRYTTAADVSRATAALADGYTALMRLISSDDFEARYAQ